MADFRHALAGVILLALSAGAAAEEEGFTHSLLFNQAEAEAIRKALADYQRLANGTEGAEAEAGAKRDEPAVPNIYVTAVADYGEGQWTVWANGLRIGPRQDLSNFQILSVKGDLVEIAVPGDRPAHFFLHPFQTWRSRSNEVVEGIAP